MSKIPLLILILIGFLQGISLSFIYLLPILIFSYYFFLKKIIFSQTTKESFYIGWCFGFGFFLGSMHWIISPFLIYDRHFYLSPLVIIIFPLLMGVFFSIHSVLISEFKKRFDLTDGNFLFSKSFFISLCFFFTEVLRSTIFGGLPFNLTAHIWAFQSELIQIAKFLGVFGLSFLTINWIVLVSFNFFSKKIKSSFIILFFFPTFLISLDAFLDMVHKKESNNEKITLRVVQPNIPQIDKWNRLYFQDNLEKLIDLSKDKNQSDKKKNCNMA